jgi:hypothetical protein
MTDKGQESGEISVKMEAAKSFLRHYLDDPRRQLFIHLPNYKDVAEWLNVAQVVLGTRLRWVLSLKSW